MGLFGTLKFLDDLLDGDGADRLEQKLTSAIDKLEQGLDAGLSKAENGVRAASDSVDKLDQAGQKLTSQAKNISDKIQG